MSFLKDNTKNNLKKIKFNYISFEFYNFEIKYKNKSLGLTDDLEMERVLNLQATQEEMMKKLSLIESDGVISSSAESSHVTSPRMDKKKMDGTTMSTTAKRHRWKNWGWKHSPAKSLSIEEEPSPDSPRLSQQSSINSTPNNSPKHKYKPVIDVNSNVDDTALSFRRKKQTNNSKIDPKTKSEIRSSAGARLFTMFDGKDGFNKSDESDEFRALLTNGRPASIHIIQSDIKDEF